MMAADNNPFSISPHSRFPYLFSISVFFVLLFVLLFPIYRSGELFYPSEEGDGYAYENLGYSVWHGWGYGHSWSEPEWRKPYEAFSIDNRHIPALERQGSFETTAFRPPLVSFVIAAVYSVVGRSFAAVRVLNCILIAASLCFLAFYCIQKFGFRAAVLFLILALLDPTLTYYATRILTEPVSYALITFLMTLACFVYEGVRLKTVAIGVITGLLLLTRSNFLFIPFAVMGMLSVLENYSWRDRMMLVLLFLFPVALISVPWAIRNVRVIERFMPFGTMAGYSLPAGFSDQAIATRGVWLDPTFISRENLKLRAGALGEGDLAYHHASVAVEWIKRNLRTLPYLLFLKIKALWWSDAIPFQRIIFPIFLIALASIRGLKHLRVFVALLFLGLTAVCALSWNVPEGRLLHPFHPVALFIITLWLTQLIEKRPTSPNFART